MGGGGESGLVLRQAKGIVADVTGLGRMEGGVFMFDLEVKQVMGAKVRTDGQVSATRRYDSKTSPLVESVPRLPLLGGPQVQERQVRRVRVRGGPGRLGTPMMNRRRTQ